MQTTLRQQQRNSQVLQIDVCGSEVGVYCENMKEKLNDYHAGHLDVLKEWQRQVMEAVRGSYWIRMFSALFVVRCRC